MANPKHVALVRNGAKAIAEWRKAHPKERLVLSDTDLSTADLSEADLSGADLRRANLRGADLSVANLSAAILSGADLDEANLSQADLIGADLSDANLIEADLRLADLSGAKLISANLTGANLRDANLSAADASGAFFADTSLGNTYLSKTRGLETAMHFAPSSIGVDTLIASVRGAGGKLTPELTTFFRAAGVPEELLKEVPRIVAKVKYYSCFISYGQPDLKFAEKLREDLKGRDVDCWLYEKDKTVGKRTGHEIVIERQGAERMVVLCSGKALVRDRFLEEIEDQINEEPDKMVPISLDNLWKEPGFKVMRNPQSTDLKPFLLDKNYADFANKPYDEALADLLKGLRRP